MVPCRQTAWTNALAASLSSIFALGTSTLASAAEFGALRALQHGPIGDSPQFADIEELEAEGAASLTRNWGKYTMNDDADTKVTSTSVKMRTAVGGGWAPNKSFALSGYVDATVASDADEEQKRATPDTTLDTGHYRHELALFGTFRNNPLVVGGGLGVLIVGSEQRQFMYGEDKYRQNVTSAAMPVLRLFGGLSTKDVDATLGVRIFSMGEAVVEAEKPGGDKQEYDIVRRNPGEVHADARLKLDQATIAGSVAYVLTSQASEQKDEFSLRYTQDGNSKVRAMGNTRRNDNQLKVAAGARFDPTKMVGILGGVTYIGANYADESLASLEHENLGGFRLDVGGDVQVQNFKGFLHAGYTMDSSASYRVDNADRASTNIEQTQRPVVNEGDRVKVSQGSWQIALGGGAEF